MAAIVGNQPSKLGSSLRAQRSPRWLGYGHNGYAWWKERRRERRRVSIIAYYHIGPKLNVSRVHVPQTLTIAKDDLTRAGKSEHALVVKLRKCP
jgi:hypothetical protein